MTCLVKTNKNLDIYMHVPDQNLIYDYKADEGGWNMYMPNVKLMQLVILSFDQDGLQQCCSSGKRKEKQQLLHILKRNTHVEHTVYIYRGS